MEGQDIGCLSVIASKPDYKATSCSQWFLLQWPIQLLLLVKMPLIFKLSFILIQHEI